MKKASTISSKHSSKAKDEFMAAAIGDLEWLKQSLRKQENYANYDENGMTALHLAATHGRFDCLKYLVEELKMDVDLASKHGWRPLHLCINKKIGKKALTTMLFLMHHGASLSIQNEDGFSPVHQAASEGHVVCLKQLLESGADFSLVDHQGNRPIDIAKLWGNKQCAKILATYGWHKDKSQEAREQLRLKKSEILQILLKTEEELCDSSNEKGRHVRKKYLGEESFQKWLEDTVENKKAAKKAERDKEIQEKIERDVKLKKYYEDLKKRTPQKLSTLHDPQFTTAVKQTPFFHPYPGNLKDVYPRNPLTLQPFDWSTPLNLNPATNEKVSKLLTQNPELVQQVGKQRSSIVTGESKDRHKKNPDSLLMHYASNSVLDLASKKSNPTADLYKAEDAAFCFGSDLNSSVFRNALARGLPDEFESFRSEVSSSTVNSRSQTVDVLICE